MSSVPATRQDVTNLQEMLDTRLQQTQARETGICPVRRELYTQCFGKANLIIFRVVQRRVYIDFIVRL